MPKPRWQSTLTGSTPTSTTQTSIIASPIPSMSSLTESADARAALWHKLASNWLAEAFPSSSSSSSSSASTPKAKKKGQLSMGILKGELAGRNIYSPGRVRRYPNQPVTDKDLELVQLERDRWEDGFMRAVNQYIWMHHAMNSTMGPDFIGVGDKHNIFGKWKLQGDLAIDTTADSDFIPTPPPYDNSMVGIIEESGGLDGL